MEQEDFDYARQVQCGEYQELEEVNESGEPVQKKAKGVSPSVKLFSLWMVKSW